MTEKQAFGVVYSQLRIEAGDTLQEVADKLDHHGLDVKTRAGVSRLEERGSMDLPVIRAYSRVFGTSQTKIERMAKKVLENDLVAV